MLTKNDLDQIRILVREEIQRELKPIEKRIETLEKKIDFLERKVDKGFKRVDRKINIVISGFDSEILDLRKRLN